MFLSICRYPIRRFSDTAKSAVKAGGNLMGSPVVHFEITGNDGDLLKKFYGELFEWKIDSDNPLNYGMVAAEEGGIGGGISKAQQGPGMVTVYPECRGTGPPRPEFAGHLDILRDAVRANLAAG
jgi:hypothetical protein